MPRKERTPQLVAAIALADFAERWDRQLWRMAGKVTCQCQPPRESKDESGHDPDCPVGLMRQAGRLMCEEASEAFEAAKC